MPHESADMSGVFQRLGGSPDGQGHFIGFRIGYVKLLGRPGQDLPNRGRGREVGLMLMAIEMDHHPNLFLRVNVMDLMARVFCLHPVIRI